jgi:hypothetical protein
MKNMLILTAIIGAGTVFGAAHESQGIEIYARNASGSAYDVTMTIVGVGAGFASVAGEEVKIAKSGDVQHVGTVVPRGWVEYTYFGRFKNWAPQTYTYDTLKALADGKPGVLFTYYQFYPTTVSPYSPDNEGGRRPRMRIKITLMIVPDCKLQLM